MRWFNSWRLPLRLARRDALRSRGRSLLVLVMIALPVLAVTAADVAIHTQNVSGSEGLDRRIGSAAARVDVQEGIRHVVQGTDPDDLSFSSGSSRTEPLTAQDVRDALPGARLVPERTAGVRVATDKGVGDVEVTEVDLRDPVSAGLVDLTSGRLPTRRHQVVVNQALLDKGYAVGGTLDLTDNDGSHNRGIDPTIVGVAESTSTRDYPVAAGPLGSLGVAAQGTHTWLVDSDSPVTWAQVRALNRLGASVLSREVINHPPPPSQLDPKLSEYGQGTDQAIVAAAALVVVMALIEVVLLAGPAFAVGARRQSRSLALMAAAGGTPRQSRRVVLAGAVVLGATASVLGVLLGIGVGWLALPVLQQRSASWFGPFEVPWLQLGGVAIFGLVSALLAAVVPAFIASRQDVVAILAGRRGDRRPSLRSPLLGLILFGAGIAGAAYGAKADIDGEYFIAGSAILSVLGMILLVPLLLVALSALSAKLPLTLRYAVRDAARHRARTVPAVAAVAATVAGVVALGIATGSDEAQNRASYQPTLATGTGAVTSIGGRRDWSTYRSIVEREIPGSTVTEVRGLPQGGAHGTYTEFSVGVPGRGSLLDSMGSSLGSVVLVSDHRLPPGLEGVPAAAVPAAEQELAGGGVVAFASSAVKADKVRFTVHTYRSNGRANPPTRATLDAVVIALKSNGVGAPGPEAVISTLAATRLGIPARTVGLAVTGTDITKQQETDATEALAGLSNDVGFYVERGYQADQDTVNIQLVLAGLGALLMLGGTLTATFLALSDARPDLATLSAVGATPRMRRGVAAAYAVVVGMVGAVLGAAVGFIPGIAITYPLTGYGYAPTDAGQPSHYIDVPWLLIGGLVVALPLVTAVIVGLTARSKLPMVARLE